MENFLAGPLASMWLGDAGADVVKVESPKEGDYSRQGSPSRSDDNGVNQGVAFLRSNRNKKSIELDLKNPEGKRIFIQLAKQADILVENLRPGTMDRLELGWDVLHRANPKLIYVAVSGFGHGDVLPSPYSDRPAFDIVGQALGGLMYRPERADDRPTYLGFSLADLQGGILAVQGALLALFQRVRTGIGQKVDISLYDACLVLNELSITMYSISGIKPEPGLHAITAPFGAYETIDGYIVIAVLGEHIWKRFCEAIERPDLLDDDRFKDGISRQRNIKALNHIIDPWLRTRHQDEVIQTLLAFGVPSSKINDVEDLLHCPHVAARKMILNIDDPVWGRVAVTGNPIKMSGVAEAEISHPPLLGQHTDEVLRNWLDLDPVEITALRKNNVI